MPTRKSFENLMRAAGKATAKSMRAVEAVAAAPAPILVPLDVVELDALDGWIAGQPEPRPSRPEAIRRLLAERLGAPRR